MNPIDPRTLELIHGELDDELDPAAREELSARLAADPEAREFRDQMQRMAQSLAMLAPVEPPVGLRQRWHASPSAVAPTRQARRPRWLRPVAAIAAGGVLVALALGLGDFGRQQMDASQLVGTMAPGVPTPAVVRFVPVEAPGLSGSVSVAPDKGGWNLVFDLESAGPVSVSATYDPARLRLEGYERAGSGERPFSATPGKIAFVNDGAQHLSLHLQPGKGGQVGIVFEGSEGILQRLAISVPPAPAAE
jgi:hypothetical protein